jgi:hypothetical protein
MKPRLPSETKSGDLCDKRGVPIVAGDLLRSYHFTHRHRRRVCYLYHAVILKQFGADGAALVCVPVAQLMPGSNSEGGTCYLHSLADADGVVRDAEVIDGPLGRCGADELGDFAERPRRKLPKSQEAIP